MFYFRQIFRQVLQSAQGTRSVANVFWNVVADSRADWTGLVTNRLRSTCAGVGLMAGYGNPAACMVTAWCNAIPNLQDAMLQMASVFFVDVPIMDCVCRQSAGFNFRQNVIDRCWKDAPDLYKPLLLNMMSMDNPSTLCEAVVALAKSDFSTAMEPVFGTLQEGNRQMASVMDWLVGGGSCLDFQNNPYVLALIPEPTDYWMVCGNTSLCRTRCADEFNAFLYANTLAGIVTSTTSLETVNSLFFNSKDPYSTLDLTPLTMLEVANCTEMCGWVQVEHGFQDRCFLLAGSTPTSLQIRGYCVPIQIGANVRSGGSYTMDLVPGAIQVESSKLSALSFFHPCHFSELLKSSDENFLLQFENCLSDIAHACLYLIK